jgi:hypothetical protein
MSKILHGLILCFYVLHSFAWNAAGHKVVAQIAYDNLSPKARDFCYKYLHSRNYNTANASFIRESTWMDEIRYKKIFWYDAMHYIDIPFSNDGSQLPSIDKTNAIRAMKHAITVLSNRSSSFTDRKLALRMLIHITGDIHQPLHAITRVSAQHPKGDLGGNLFLLGKNSVGNNLHQYWDNGAGFFLGQFDEQQVKNTARNLQKNFNCATINSEIKPKKWAKMSYKIAVKNVYHIEPRASPNKKYQKNAQLLVQKQIVYAGCRLAAVLNSITRS